MHPLVNDPLPGPGVPDAYQEELDVFQIGPRDASVSAWELHRSKVMAWLKLGGGSPPRFLMKLNNSGTKGPVSAGLHRGSTASRRENQDASSCARSVPSPKRKSNDYSSSFVRFPPPFRVVINVRCNVTIRRRLFPSASYRSPWNFH